MALLQISEPDINNKPPKKNIAIGIDLGTTNSLVATVKNKEAVVLANETNDLLTPSVVHYDKNKTITVGKNALSQRVIDPENTIVSIKRFMGKSSLDIDTSKYPYKFSDNNKLIEIKTNQGNKNPIDVSSEILKYLKNIAINNLGESPSGAVITVPAYLDDAGRQATKHAAQLAGLKVLRLLNEPTAAAIAYGLDSKNEGKFLVYDLGGGTLDVSILNLYKGVFEVLAVSGNSNLGGDDFDYLVYNHILKKSKINKTISKKDKAQLLNIAKFVKEQLSFQEEIEINTSLSNGLLIKTIITQKEFFEISHHLVASALLPIKKAIRDAQLNLEQIDEIIMVGGSSRMPNIRHAVEKLFHKPLHTEIDPDKVVAIGAAIQADILAGNRRDDWLLLDVTPLSLGIETMGGLVEKIIPRNSTIPITRAQDFTTYKDGQTAMSIHVLQGEREMVSDCRSLAKFALNGIPPLAAGIAKIRITFQIDADGLLSVSAQETTTGVISSIEVKPSFGLNNEQISNMLQSSITHAKDDILIRQLSESIIKAKDLIKAISKAINEDSALLSENEITKIENKLSELKVTIIKDLEIKIKTELINNLSNELNSLTQDFADKRMSKALLYTSINNENS